MAKDAKGHGSEGRNSGGTTQTEAVLKGMNNAAVKAGVTPRQGFGNPMVQDKQAANALAQDHPKSVAPPVHSAMTPAQSENAPFKSGLGAAAGHSFLDPHDPRAGATPQLHPSWPREAGREYK